METNSVIPALKPVQLPMMPVKSGVQVNNVVSAPKEDQFVQVAKEQGEKSDLRSTLDSLSEKAKNISPQDKALALKSLSLGAMVSLVDKVLKVETGKALGAGVLVAALSFVSKKFIAPAIANLMINKQETQKPQ